MSGNISIFLELAGKALAVLLVANEIRGLILTAPVFYGLYQAGGTPMAIWIAICSLGGIVLSVVVPLFAAGKLKKLVLRYGNS
ncbi:hypothetical protein [Aurantiacibacter gilvus]|uniref:Uncharacterized protein n=1 Tax=Aurantiacibacter gilvus TaxID=3139141 RepID=A0ABU9IF08_9SPHN